MNTPDRTAATEANRLYWDTDTSVAEIAERLGWSRRALYDAIEPLPTEIPCATCGTPLVYANRSARSSGTASCYVCAEREEAAATKSSGANRDASLEQMAVAEARDRRERAWAVGGAAAVGVAIGTALTFLLVPRR